MKCYGKPKPGAGPFLVSPFKGWVDINSFVDHDAPDYTLDGLIVLANGLSASAHDGQSSDFFPAYWSSALRQFINYDGHNGYDYGLSYAPLYAAAGGTVSFAGWAGSSEYDSYGQMVLIDHRNGYVTLYGHLSKLEVSTGDSVEAGQRIGISGSTGRSSGPHLHFSVYHNCQVTDPYGWTGRGTDPLFTNNGEKASYLWLPGYEPLVLNPPPKWPAFPAGLRLSIPSVSYLARHGVRHIPPADRLLLLRLPISSADATSSSTVALARTEALLAEEAANLSPLLNALRAQGLIDNYQIIPAAGAVWVRGNASATQLEGLPGVASLAGVEPRDLIAAQVGLGHSVLIQLGSQQAPALWPLGFRSALHAWRPLVTVCNGSPLLSGFTLPGDFVTITLRRGTKIVGSASAFSDPQSGGFVATVHDQSGNPVPVHSGELVSARSGGRASAVSVVPIVLKARSTDVSGSATSGVTIALTATTTSGAWTWKKVLTVDTAGNFRAPLRRRFPAGTLVIATVVNAAGNQESTTSFVPGAEVHLGDSRIRGWTVGSTPRLTIERGGRILIGIDLHPTADGTFMIDLRNRSGPLALASGDVVRLGSRWHSHTFTLPRLAVRLPFGQSSQMIEVPPGQTATFRAIRVFTDSKSTVSTSIRDRTVSRAWPFGRIQLGDAATLEVMSDYGDRVIASSQVRQITVRQGAALVTGMIRPGQTAYFQSSGSNGGVQGRLVASSDPTSGAFSGVLRDAAGRRSRLQPGQTLEVQDASGVTVLHIPHLAIQRTRQTGEITGTAPAGAHVSVLVRDATGSKSVRAAAGKGGAIRLKHAMQASGGPVQSVSLRCVLGQGVTLQSTTTFGQALLLDPGLQGDRL